MPHFIEDILEGTVPFVLSAKKLRILDERELRTITKKRRDHEYAIVNPNAKRKDFLRYAAFEKGLHSLLTRRTKKLYPGRQNSSTKLILTSSEKWASFVFSRAVRRFPGDVELWIQYVRHHLYRDAITTSRILSKALAVCGSDERIWLVALGFHFDVCNDARTARVVGQRALRALPHSLAIWLEYFRLELFFLARLTTRRFAIGLPPDGLTVKLADSDLKDGMRTKPDHAETNAPSPPENGTKIVDGNSDSDDSTDSADNADGNDNIDGAANTDRDDNAEITHSADGDGCAHSAGNTDSDCIAGLDVDAEGGFERKKNGNEVARGQNFWNGAVPLAVLRAACKSAPLTPMTGAQFYDIAAKCPLVPPKMLGDIVKILSKRFRKCAVSQHLQIRVFWDVRLAYFRRDEVMRLHARSGDDASAAKSAEAVSSKEAKSLLSRANVVLQRLEEALHRNDEWKGQKVVKEALAFLLQGLWTSIKALGGGDGDDQPPTLQRLFNLIDNAFGPGQPFAKRNGDGRNDEGMKDGMEIEETWDLNSLEALFNQKTDEATQVPDAVRHAVRKLCLIPFRGAHEDRVLCAYMSMETDVSRLVDVCKEALKVPPVTMASLRSCVDQFLRLFESSQNAGTGEWQQEITLVRKFLEKGSSLPEAKRDVDFWLSYMRFEGYVVKDAKLSCAVNAKAMRVLGSQFVETFIERQTLTNIY